MAGGGRIDKPILKAGRSYHKFKAKRKSWPIVRGVTMNVCVLLSLSDILFHSSSLLTIHLVVVIINTLANHRLSVDMLHPVVKSVSLLLVVQVVFVVQRSPKKINLSSHSHSTYTQKNYSVFVFFLNGQQIKTRRHQSNSRPINGIHVHLDI